MSKWRLSKKQSVIVFTAGILIILCMLLNALFVFHEQTNESSSIHLMSHIVFFIILIFLLVYIFLTVYFLIRNDNSLHELQSKLGHITENDNIVTMQYDVAKKIFTRWNEMTGKPYRLFSLDEYWTYIHPDDLPIARKLVDYMNSGETREYSCEYRYLFPNAKNYSWQFNSVYPNELNRKGKATNYIGICRKNNQWHEMNDILLRYRRRISYIADAANIVFTQYDVDTDTVYELDNHGEVPDHVITFEEILLCVHPDDIGIAKAIITQVREHKEENIQYDYRYSVNKDDKYLWLHFSAIAFDRDENGEISRYLGLNINTDAWHQAMREIQDLSYKVEQIQMFANSIKNIGQKVRTPLNAVMGFADVMSDEESEARRLEYRKIVDDHSALLIKMSDDLLDIVKIGNSHENWKKDFLVVSTHFDSLLQKFNHKLYPGVNINLRSDSPKVRIGLEFDLIDKVFFSLLNYTANYSKGGTVTVDYEINDSCLHVSVSDPSFSIDKAAQEMIFNHFDNHDHSSKYIPGIGLPICKKVILKHNGKIGVESNPDTGTTFWFWIPCEM